MPKVAYSFDDIQNDLIQIIGNTTLPTPLTPKQWIDNNSIGTWWIELSQWGYPALCTNIPDYTDLQISASTPAPVAYTIKPTQFIKGRPDDRK